MCWMARVRESWRPNKGVELTASSVRSCLAPAFSRSSRRAFGHSDGDFFHDS